DAFCLLSALSPPPRRDLTVLRSFPPRRSSDLVCWPPSPHRTTSRNGWPTQDGKLYLPSRWCSCPLPWDSSWPPTWARLYAIGSPGTPPGSWTHSAVL